MASFPCMRGLYGLFPASGERFMSAASLEIDLPGKIVMCSILNLLVAADVQNGNNYLGIPQANGNWRGCN